MDQGRIQNFEGGEARRKCGGKASIPVSKCTPDCKTVGIATNKRKNRTNPNYSMIFVNIRHFIQTNVT